MGRLPKGKKAEPKASPPKKVDESKIEWLDGSAIDRSQRVISLDNKKFKTTSDIIPYDKKEAKDKEVFVLFKEPDRDKPTHLGSMYRGVVTKYTPQKKAGQTHFVKFDDGDEGYFNLAEETVIWPDGTVTGPGSKWKGDVEDKKQAGGGSSGKKRGRAARGAPAEEEEEGKEEKEGKGKEEAEKVEEEPMKEPVPAAPEAATAAAAAAVEKSKKRKAPSSAEKKEEEKVEIENLPGEVKAKKPTEITVTEPAAAAAPAAEVAAPSQQVQQEKQQQQQQEEETKTEEAAVEVAPSTEQQTTSPKQQPQAPSRPVSADVPQPKKPKLQHQQQQQLPRGVVKPPPPPPGVPPSKRDSLITPATGAPVGPSKPQKGQQKQQQPTSHPLSTDPKIAALQQTHRRLKDASEKYLAALETLKSSSETIKSVVKELTSEHVLKANEAGLPKLVSSTVKQALQPPPPITAAGAGAGAGGSVSHSTPGWFEVHGMNWLNDVPEAMKSMRDLLNTWFESSNKPPMPEGPQLKAWMAERSSSAATALAAKDAGAGAAAAGSGVPVTTTGDKKLIIPQQQQGKVEEESIEDLIPSTGDEMRDKVVRVLAHALVTATTPIDAAREMEQAMFYQLCNSKNTSNDTNINTAAAGGAGPGGEIEKTTTGGEETANEGMKESKVNEAYYGRMRVIWEALSPKSPTCHPILRYMLLTGMVAPTELVNITAEQLKRKQEEAVQQLTECRPGWLAEQLRNVQLPYHPPAAVAAVAPAAAMVPGSNEKEGGPVAAAGVPALAGNGAVERKDAAPAAAAAAGGDSPKAVDMELD